MTREVKPNESEGAACETGAGLCSSISSASESWKEILKQLHHMVQRIAWLDASLTYPSSHEGPQQPQKSLSIDSVK